MGASNLFEIQNWDMAFLSLIIALEVLLNPGDSELIHTISRNVAILLSQNESSFDKIFKDIKRLYKKRSDIIHRGQLDSIDNDDFLEARQYVREVINTFDYIGKDKKELLAILNKSGFGPLLWESF